MVIECALFLAQSLACIEKHTHGILRGEINLVTEDNEPFVELYRRQNQTIRSASVLTVMIKCLQHQLRCGGTREVQPDNLAKI